MANLDLAASPVATFDPWSQPIVTYAPCGIADLARGGRRVSRIGTLAPGRPVEAVSLGTKSQVTADMAAAMTAAVIGMSPWSSSRDV